jgi:hypothetical protein
MFNILVDVISLTQLKKKMWLVIGGAYTQG